MSLEKKPLPLKQPLFAMHIVAILVLGVSAIAIGVLVSRVNTSPTTLTMTCFGQKVFSQSSGYLKWLLPVFPALSVVNHVVSVSTYETYLKSLSLPEQGPVFYRWLEYGASASVMLWIIGQLSGVQEVPQLVTLCLVNVMLQFCGYVIEKTGDKDWMWTAMGYVLFVILFATILPYFFGSLQVAKDRNVSVPGAVYSVVFIELLLFLSFGIVSSYFAFTKDQSVDQRMKREIAYVSLSVTSKTLLAWLVYGGCLNIAL